jgi:hypothetical protein
MAGLFLHHAARTQGVVRVGVGVMGVIVVMGMAVIMRMIMGVIMVMAVIVLLMHMRRGVEILVRNLARTDAFHMMVMAFLGQADFHLETQDLFAVFAIQAVHVVGAFQGFVDPIGEGVQHQRVVVKV